MHKLCDAYREVLSKHLVTISVFGGQYHFNYITCVKLGGVAGVIISDI